MALVQQSYGVPPVAAAPAAPPSAAASAAGSVRVATAAGAPVSRLAQMQARFQKKQMEEKEQKLLRLYESQQQRAFQRVGRGSAGGSSTASLSSSTSTLASVGLGGGGGGGAGKVRQLFEERRTNGWDRSYPLEPVAGSKARSGPHPAQQQQQQAFAHTQALPLAVPKTKVARGASLDRSHAAHAPHAKSVARRSKSHARAEALHAADDPAANKLYYDGGGHGYRKIPAASNNAHHHNNNNHQHHVDEYNNRNNYRRQQVAPPHDDNYEDDFEDDVNYETLGEDVPRHARNGNGNSNGFTVLPDKRQEELFAKYQVRELRNHDLLVNTSPPPDAYDVDGIDDSTFIYEKPANVGGPLRAAEEPVNNSDRFKTYVSNKHGQRALYKEEITPRAPSHAMATRASEAKKAPAGRRESLSPPTRAAPAARPAPRKPQEKPSTGTKTLVKSPPGSLSSTGAIAPKQGASSVSRPASSAINKNNYNNKMKPSPTSSKMKNGPSSQTLRTAPSRDDLTECHICHRRFTNDRIKVHEEICSKTAQKKRKEYDATKHRVQGTEAEQFVKRAVKNGPQKKVEPKKADWRKKHEEFIQTIRAAKEAQAHVAAGGKLSDLPPPPPLDTSDYIQCPHCGRRFNEAAAERHIPRCANMQHNKPKAPANKSSGSFCKRR